MAGRNVKVYSYGTYCRACSYIANSSYKKTAQGKKAIQNYMQSEKYKKARAKWLKTEKGQRYWAAHSAQISTSAPKEIVTMVRLAFQLRKELFK